MSLVVIAKIVKIGDDVRSVFENWMCIKLIMVRESF